MMRFAQILIAGALLARAATAHAAAGDGLPLRVPPVAQAENVTDGDESRLRVVEPGALPDEVERFVRYRATGLGEDRPAGGTIELTALFDGNVNRVTRADPLGSTIAGLLPGDAALAAGNGLIGEGIAPGGGVRPPAGPLDPAPPAVLPRARSALGAALRGQAFVRRQLNNDADLLVRLSGTGEWYGDRRFDDVSLALQVGPEWAVGSDRIALFAGPSARWYGAAPYSVALGGGLAWQHPLGRGGQLRVEAGAARVDNRRDPLLDGGAYTLAAELDRRLDRRAGVGARLLLTREAARDPAYALTSGGVELHAYRVFAPLTLVATAGYARLEADAAFPGFAEGRREDRFTASLGATIHAWRLGPLAPTARLRWENNRSNLWFYAYARWSGELGLALAF